ncbi:MAG: EAL domain-containing protein, partial [Rhodospirillales bacterium]|nr:EAL domain-containing protein [Acetobacter sp.]
MLRDPLQPLTSKAFSAVPYRALPLCTFAFQPIVSTSRRSIVAYEALVRGARGEGASTIISGIAAADLPEFDELCRSSAMRLAARLGIECDLHLNLVPHGFHADRDCLASTLDAAIEFNFFPERLVVEVTEAEVLGNQDRFTELMDVYRGLGMRLAIDDFGSGYSGLNLLAEFQPNQLKLDKKLAQGITGSGARQAIVRAIVQVCRDLGIELVAEGIETADEFRWFCDQGVSLFQGYFFGRPGFELLPALHTST